MQHKPTRDHLNDLEAIFFEAVTRERYRLGMAKFVFDSD